MHKSQYPNTFYRVSLKAVIRNEKGEVLLCKEGDADNWSLPGGGWDHGETEHDALARELHEEVGYTGEFAASPRQTAVWWVESKQAWLLWIVYDVTFTHQEFAGGADSSGVAFVDPNQLKKSVHRTEQWVYQNL